MSQDKAAGIGALDGIQDSKMIKEGERCHRGSEDMDPDESLELGITELDMIKLNILGNTRRQEPPDKVEGVDEPLVLQRTVAAQRCQVREWITQILVKGIARLRT